VKKNKITFIDGSPEEQKKAVGDFLSTLSEDEHARAISDEFSYLDDNDE